MRGDRGHPFDGRNRKTGANKRLKSDGGKKSITTRSEQKDSWEFVSTETGLLAEATSKPANSDLISALKGEVKSSSAVITYNPIPLDEFVSEWVVPVYTYHASTVVLDSYKQEEQAEGWQMLETPILGPALQGQQTVVKFPERKKSSFVFKNDADYIARFRPEPESNEVLQVANRTWEYAVGTVERIVTEAPLVGEASTILDQLSASENYIRDVHDIVDGDDEAATKSFWFNYESDTSHAGRRAGASFVRFFILLDPGETVDLELTNDSTYVGHGNQNLFQLTHSVPVSAPEHTPDVPASPEPRLDSPASVRAGNPISFDASRSAASVGAIKHYFWQIKRGDETLDSGTGSKFKTTFPTQGTYNLILVVVDERGVTETLSRNVSVDPPSEVGERPANEPPTAIAKIQKRSEASASSESVMFDATDSSDPDGSISEYKWTVVDTSSGDRVGSATGATMTQTLSAGTYDVEVTVTDDDGASDTDSKTVSVDGSPHRLIIVGTAEADGSTYNFRVTGSLEQVDGTLDGYEVTEDPSDEVTGTTATGWVSGGADGFRFTGELDQFSLDSPEHVNVYIDGDQYDPRALPSRNRVPTAAFDANPPNPNPDEAVTFDAGASEDPDGTIAEYEWAFTDLSGDTSGETETATGKLESRSLPTGTYQIELTVTDDGGATAQKTKELRVGGYPHTLVIQGTPDSGGSKYSFAVSGDLKQVEGTVASHHVTKDSSDKVDGNQASGWIGGGADGFRYSGELTELTVETPEQATVFVDGERRDDDAPAHEPPEPRIEYSPKEPLRGDRVTFNADQSTDPDGTILDFEWVIRRTEDSDSAPVATATGSHLSYTFDEPSEYSIELTITDDSEQTTTDTVDLQIAEPQTPTAIIQKPAEPVIAGDEVTFRGGQSSTPNGSITTYEWKFYRFESGEINQEPIARQTGRTATYSFTDPVTYSVRLAVTDDVDQTHTTSTLVEVSKPNRPPTPHIDRSFEKVYVGGTVTLDGSGSTDPDNDIASYEWNIDPPTGESVTATGPTTEYTVSDSGTHDVRLRITDTEGKTGSTTATFVAEDTNFTSPD
jgi:hypothetical protein